MDEVMHCNVHPEHTATKGQKDGWCPHCLAELAAAPDPEALTVEEKLAEWDRWCGPLWVPFDKLHERAEKLMGGPIWTHEFARPEWIRQRIEAGGRDKSPMQTIAEVAPHANVIAVEL